MNMLSRRNRRYITAFIFCVFVGGASLSVCHGALAEDLSGKQAPLSIFDRKSIDKSFFAEDENTGDVRSEKISAEKAAAPIAENVAASNKTQSEVAEKPVKTLVAPLEKQDQPVQPVAEKQSVSEGDQVEGALSQMLKDKPAFVSNDPSSHLAPPNEDPKVRINPEAPGPFIAMADAYQRGDTSAAKLFARQFVRYMVNVIFQVKQITQLIGEAMIQEGVIEEDQWVGVEQYLDYELALARSNSNSPVKATHEEALKRIEADPKGEAEIYYFLTFSSSFSRKMGPDVERLWQIAKKDSRIKMVALSLGPVPQVMVDEYSKYTGLTLPILNGEKVAKQFRVAFVPAVVVVAPNSGKAYLKTGQQDFKRLYEFVKTVQGESIEMSADAVKLAAAKIGYVERNGKQLAKGGVVQVTEATEQQQAGTRF